MAFISVVYTKISFEVVVLNKNLFVHVFFALLVLLANVMVSMCLVRYGICEQYRNVAE